MYIVAHQDDDLLFMNPDIQELIQERHYVRVLYLTAGDACRGTAYMQGRENGIKTAYAKMAGVSNTWAFVSRYRSAETLVLSGSRVSVVFFRLPGGVCYSSTKSLRRLWEGKVGRVTSFSATGGTSYTYTKTAVINTIVNRMNVFRPDFIGIQDKTAQAPPGVSSYKYTFYNAACRVTNKSEHPDHISTALFAEAAHEKYTRPHTLLIYRGYNIANEPKNLTFVEMAQKQVVFDTYRAYDSALDPLPCLYNEWIPRQYIAD
jgi:hypothetical protein